jgi:hypothetical protein
MSERTRDGLEATCARGRTGGQKPKLGPPQARLAREMYEAGELTVAQIAAEFGVTRPTNYRHLDKLNQQLTTTNYNRPGHLQWIGQEPDSPQRQREPQPVVLAPAPIHRRSTSSRKENRSSSARDGGPSKQPYAAT